MLTLLLDSLENHHIMTTVHALQMGLPVSAADGELQMIASQVKFHASYLATFLFALGFLRLGRWAASLRSCSGVTSPSAS